MANTILEVPYKQKDQVKALGARWDASLKKWYVPEGNDLSAFKSWLPTSSPGALISPASQATVALQAVNTEPGTATALDTRQAVSLSQLLSGVAQVIAKYFSAGVWTVVEVVEARIKNGHVYLELSERNAEGSVLATARASIWANTANKILPEFERATGASLAPGIKLLVRAKPVFKAQYGFSIEIDAIDPEYTLGDLEAKKREIRTRLKQEGVIDANKRLPAPWDYNSVVVIAPQGAAGLGDFKAEAQRLEGFGICRFVYAHSRFQGEGAPQEIRQTLLATLERWSGPAPDAVVIIRGGGAVNDLAWLNDYELAKTLCTLKIPVLTGIGHERDSTLLDEVANTRFDTPSKVIAGIEQVIRKRVGEAQTSFEQIARLAQQAITASRASTEQQFTAIQSGATRQLTLARQQCSELMNALRLSATHTLHEAKQGSRHLMTEVRHEAHQGLIAAQSHVPALMAEIRTEAANVLNTARSITATRLEGIRDRAKLDLLRCREGTQLELRDIATYARRALTEAKTSSTALFREIAGQGPEKTLGRGFAIVRNAEGKPVTSQTEVQYGATLDIQFRDGHVTTQAT